MTHSRIEKKKPKWPWMLMTLITVTILIFIFTFNTDEKIKIKQGKYTEQHIEKHQDKRQNALDNADVIAYVDFTKKNSNPIKLDHEFISEAFSKLIKAIAEMGDEIDYDTRRNLKELKIYSNKITKNTFETSHANYIRKSAEVLASELQNIQRKAYSDLRSETDEVKNAATSIKSNILTLNQKENIKKFFRKSAILLEKMNTYTPKM